MRNFSTYKVDSKIQQYRAETEFIYMSHDFIFIADVKTVSQWQKLDTHMYSKVNSYYQTYNFEKRNWWKEPT